MKGRLVTIEGASGPRIAIMVYVDALTDIEDCMPRGPLPELPPSYPNRQEIQRVLKHYAISNKEFADMAGVDERTVRRWLQDQDQPGHRFPPRMLWWLILEIKRTVGPRRFWT